MAPMALIILGVLHFYEVYRPSDVTPGKTLSTAFRQAMSSDDLDRKCASRPELLPILRKELGSARLQHERLRILIFPDKFAVLYPFFGKNASNDLEFVDSVRTMARKMAGRHYDLVVITAAHLVTNADLAFIGQHNYAASESPPGMLFLKPKQASPDQ